MTQEFKSISIGNWITISIVTANIIFTVGIIWGNIESIEKSANTALEMAFRNDKKIAVIEAKIEQGFSNLEKIIIDGK